MIKIIKDDILKRLKSDNFIPLVELLKNNKNKIFAAVAPSIAGQYGNDVSMAQLRSAFKLLGFTDMIEVALFADILTIREAYEFDKLVKSERDFFLTSCCCPLWINLVRKKYPELFAYMPTSVSPMIASGRFLKKIYPSSKVVFISPCDAKKVEAEAEDLKGDIDYVLNFEELNKLFLASKIKLEDLDKLEKDQASFAGRIYARTGGVSFSVKTVINRIAPGRLINLRAKQYHGTKECIEVLDKLSSNQVINANFIEGMGCVGGCVGGPRMGVDYKEATNHVNNFAEDSIIMTPMDNPNILDLLKIFGLNDFSDIVGDNELARMLVRESVKKYT